MPVLVRPVRQTIWMGDDIGGSYRFIIYAEDRN